MKKVLVICMAIFVLAIILIYIFIPGTLNVTQTLRIKGNQHGLYRAIIQTAKWKNWFPKSGSINTSVDNAFVYDNISYQPSQKLFDGIEVVIVDELRRMNSVISIQSLKTDSAIMEWRYEMVTGSNPVTRVQNWLFANKVQRHVKTLMVHLKDFLEKRENVYDINIQQQKVTDTFLVTLKNVFPVYPDPYTIYQMMDKINNYIKKQGAVVTNAPMLHVEMLDSNRYEIMVALPVDRKLPDQPPLIFKRMVAGNILVTEIKGGQATIKQAFRKLEDFIEDYKKVSPALPFESLVTNRMLTKDTAAWVTRIYYPIY